MPSLRTVRRDGKDLLKEARGLLKKHGAGLKPERRAQVEEARSALDEAVKGKEPERIAGAFKALDGQLEKQLGNVRKGPVRQYVESIGTAVIIALLLRIFVVEAFKIPSGSMVPTLLIGDQIFVSKFIYGIRLPFINYQLWQASTPKRGDVIVFNDPRDESKDLIKRVAGLPGDTLTVEDEVVHINGVAQPRKLVNPDFTYNEYDEDKGLWYTASNLELYEETLGTKVHPILQRTDQGRPRLTEGPFHVPAGQVFVMGDNRDNSADSRFYGGWTVPYGHIKGKAFIIFLSIGKGGWWFCHGKGFFCSESGIRINRFFKILH